MIIRRASAGDIPGILSLLSEVLELHAGIRPDIFIPGTTKYTFDELSVIIADITNPVFVAVDEAGKVAGYAFCQLRLPPDTNNMRRFSSLYIDDLCVGSDLRGCGIGRALLERVRSEAKNLGCYEITLNVWEGNDAALHFYEKMGMTVKKREMEYIL